MQVQAAGSYTLTAASSGCTCADTIQVLPRPLTTQQVAEAEQQAEQQPITVRPFLAAWPWGVTGSATTTSTFTTTPVKPESSDNPAYRVQSTNSYLTGLLNWNYVFQPMVGVNIIVK